jgi:hypothetical protein
MEVEKVHKLFCGNVEDFIVVLKVPGCPKNITTLTVVYLWQNRVVSRAVSLSYD